MAVTLFCVCFTSNAKNGVCVCVCVVCVVLRDVDALGGRGMMQERPRMVYCQHNSL